MPTRRADSATQLTGTSCAERPAATIPTPNTSAAPTARTAVRRLSTGDSATSSTASVRPGSSIASAVEIEVAGRDLAAWRDRPTRARPRPRSPPGPARPRRVIGSPSTIAITAATAPSVATIGATIETLPIRSADVGQLEPDHVADAGQQRSATVDGATPCGAGLTTATGSPTATPTIMIQARTTRDPSIRLDRELQSVAAAHSTAAPRPPRMAVIAVQCGARAGAPWVPFVRAVASDTCATIRLRARRPCLVPRADPKPTDNTEVCPRGQDAPHLDGRSHTVGTEACPSGRAPPRGPPASAQRRQDVRRQGPGRRDAADRLDRSRRRPRRGAERARPRRQGRCHPPERRRASQVAPDASRSTPRSAATALQTGARVVKTTGKAAAAKAAKARIAAGKAGKAKGAQTAAGKARAALSKTARAEAAAAKAAAEAADGAVRGDRRQGPRPPKATAKAAPRKAVDAGQAQGDGEGRAQGRCQGGGEAEEGRPPRASRRERRHDATPRDPRGVFDSGTTGQAAAAGPPRLGRGSDGTGRRGRRHPGRRATSGARSSRRSRTARPSRTR